MTRRIHKTKNNPIDGLFDSLVLNAIDFLKKSVKEIEKQPKYSVIHFYMALELFLKARLLREHWALVVSKTDKATLQTFLTGDFNSVTMDECLLRLENITNESLLQHERDCFKTIRDHRNKLVHFFHSDYRPPIDEKILAQIVSEQCKAWFYLHRLLTTKWESHFAPYLLKIARLQTAIRKNRHFLKSKFRAITPEIEAQKKKGVAFEVCGVCGFKTAQINRQRDPFFLRKCLVCDWRSGFLVVACPQCSKPVVCDGEGGGECSGCENSVELDDLLNILGPQQDPKEDDAVARCSECENFEPSVVPFGNDEYLCLNCLTLHDNVGHCGWCSELITGDTSDTSILGCFCCPGPDFDKD